MRKIPLKPISVNKCWQGRRYKTPEYEAWRNEAYYLIKQAELTPIKGYVTIEFEWIINNFAMSDEANFLKATCDAIVDAGIIEDDRKIKWHRSEKFKALEDEYFTISINPYIGNVNEKR